MFPDEIRQYFIQNQNNNICGRFKKTQLDTITIQIPNRILYTQKHYHKMFLLALFITMGTTLFSCQDKDGNKKKIDNIQIIEDAPPTEHITVDVTLPPKNEVKQVIPTSLPPKVNQVKFVKGKAKINNVKYHKTVSTNFTETTKNINEDQIIISGVTGIEVGPDFPGGIKQFYSYFVNEFKTPENKQPPNPLVKISFTVERDGLLKYIETIPPIDIAFEKEIIRVLQASPKWQPAESNGKKIRMNYSLPLVFEKDSFETSQ
jgi:hypothetical protein